jgi:hypothetical protein
MKLIYSHIVIIIFKTSLYDPNPFVCSNFTYDIYRCQFWFVVGKSPISNPSIP